MIVSFYFLEEEDELLGRKLASNGHPAHGPAAANASHPGGKEWTRERDSHGCLARPGRCVRLGVPAPDPPPTLRIGAET